MDAQTIKPFMAYQLLAPVHRLSWNDSSPIPLAGTAGPSSITAGPENDGTAQLDNF